MQIFEYDYWTGKGKKLGNAYYSGTGYGVGESNGMTVHKHFLGKVVDGKAEKFTADNWGVRAIICCTGQDKQGRWNWIVVCNKVDGEQAEKRNLERFGHKYATFKDLGRSANKRPLAPEVEVRRVRLSNGTVELDAWVKVGDAWEFLGQYVDMKEVNTAVSNLQSRNII